MHNRTFIKYVCLTDNPWIDEWMTDFATLSYTSTGEIPALIPGVGKRNPAFRRGLLVYGIMGSTCPSFVQSPMKLRGFQPFLTVTITSVEVFKRRDTHSPPKWLTEAKPETSGNFQTFKNYKQLSSFKAFFSILKSKAQLWCYTGRSRPEFYFLWNEQKSVWFRFKVQDMHSITSR